MADNPLVQAIATVFASLSNKLLLAAIVALVGLILARLLGKLTQRILQEVEIDKLIHKTFGVETALDEAVSLVVSWLTFSITFLLVLNMLGLDSILIKRVGVIIIGVIFMSVLLTLQYAIPNISAGLMMRQKGIIAKGDILTMKAISGKVTHLGMFEVILSTKDKESVYIPNQALLKEKHFSVKRHTVK